MHTRKELIDILGISYAQLRDRLEALESVDGLLIGQVKKGSKGRLEYSSAVLAMLRHLEELVRNHELGLLEAAEEVGQEIRQEGKEEVEPQESNHLNRDASVKLLEQRIADKDEIIVSLKEENKHLKEEVSYLRERVEDLMPLALPSARRRWWWPFSRRSSQEQ